jgi:GTP-binding protein Era
MTEFRSGFITLLGKPNVGKSTLLNTIIGRKVSITSDKPQTTRHRILGVRTQENHQYIFVDTPGLHEPSGKTINRIITATTRSSLAGVDVIVLMITGHGWDEKDLFVLKSLRNMSIPVVLAINKIDTIKDKQRLLPLIEESSKRMKFTEIFPISAKSGTNLPEMLIVLGDMLPVSPMCFPEDQITDRPQSFMISELIREQVFRQLGQELPYEAAVRIAGIQGEDPLRIEAHIWVARESQKGIVVGKNGQRIKEISTRARKSIEQYLGKHVYLDLFVKVRKGWADNQADLNSLGYIEGR